jgi:glycine/D-amino acid oxidase-like deaminating enzyme
MNNQSVIVVGAGIIGSSLANELVRRGCRVTVIEAAEPGGGTTAASFAWVNSNNKEPLEYFALNHAGLRAHERWAENRNSRPWFHQTGNIAEAIDGAALADLEHKVDRLHSRGYAAEMLTVGQLKDLEPAVDFGRSAGGALFAREGWVDVAMACTVLLQDVLALGGTFLPFHRVTAVDESGRVESVDETGSIRTFSADAVVLTAGNGIQEIVDSIGIDFPTLPISGWKADHDATSGSSSSPVGLTCTTSPVVGAPRHMLSLDGVSMRPARNGGLTLTDHPTASQWDLGDPRLLTVPGTLLARAQAVTAGLDDAFIGTVVLGNRVLPIDGLTIADWVGSGGRLYAVATHSGVTLAAHLAETVAEEIRTGERDESLVPFGLGRFDPAIVA